MTKEFEIKFDVDNSGDYYTITKSDQSGFVLTKWTKAKKDDAKKSHTPHNWFYPNLRQIAEKVVWLGLSGHNLDEMLTSYNEMVERVANTLEKS